MSSDLISRQAAIDAIFSEPLYKSGMKKREADEVVPAIYEKIKVLPSAQPEVIRCKDCIYYDPPHVENDGMRLEYADLPKEAFDVLGTGLVTLDYGINVGGRCTRDYNAGYNEDKRVFVPYDNFCGRAERGKENDG